MAPFGCEICRLAMNNIINKIRGKAVPVAGNDIDTDRIMPARYLRCVTFEKIGQYTFQDERFDEKGKPKDHPFNDPVYQDARVLVVGKNFGCGSSREHAPQGILRWGIQAIIGESFAEIFAGNCTSIGLPVVTAGESATAKIMAYVRQNPGAEVEVDLEKKNVSYGDTTVNVDIKESSQKMFLEGTWDSAATLMSAKDKIAETANKIPYLNW